MSDDEAAALAQDEIPPPDPDEVALEPQQNTFTQRAKRYSKRYRPGLLLTGLTGALTAGFLAIPPPE